MQEVEFLESTSCICLFDKCLVNGVLKKREILKKDYIWAAVYVAGIGQYGNYPDDYLHDVEICQSFAC